MDRRHVALGSLDGLRVDEGPGGVGVIVDGEFLPLSVLLHEESGFELWQRGALRHCHTLLDVGSHVIRTEVEHGEVVEAIACNEQNEQGRVVEYDPLIRLADHARHVEGPPGDDDSRDEQHHILPECLPVGEHEGIAKASAVAHWVVDGEPQRDECHDNHHTESDARYKSSPDGEKQADADDEFRCRQQDGSRESHEIGHQLAQVKSPEVVVDLVLCTQRVYRLDES